MDCVERDRLAEELNVIMRDLHWALKEVVCALQDGAFGNAELFGSAIGLGEQRLRETIAAYRQHVEAHGCAEATPKAAVLQ